MFNYDNLTYSRRIFIDNALKVYPELVNSKEISRSEIQEVVNRTGINYPQWFTQSSNSIRRGVFHFPVPNISEYSNQNEAAIEESDDSILERINKRFGAIDSCVKSVAVGDIKSLIISGAPGIGKTTKVTNTLEHLDNAGECNFVFYSGKIRATGLFKLLYDNRFPNTVLVADDMDSILGDEDSLNLLKKACDLHPIRKISWLTEKEFVSDEDGETIPKTFDYEGSIIFITNKDFDGIIKKDSKLSPHLEALISRSLYVNLGVNSHRELLIWIKQMFNAGMMKEKGFSQEAEDAIYEFMYDNVHKFRELSLRMAEKIGIIYQANPDNWREMAEITCFNR